MCLAVLTSRFVLVLVIVLVLENGSDRGETRRRYEDQENEDEDVNENEEERGCPSRALFAKHIRASSLSSLHQLASLAGRIGRAFLVPSTGVTARVQRVNARPGRRMPGCRRIGRNGRVHKVNARDGRRRRLGWARTIGRSWRSTTRSCPSANSVTYPSRMSQRRSCRIAIPSRSAALGSVGSDSDGDAAAASAFNGSAEEGVSSEVAGTG